MRSRLAVLAALAPVALAAQDDLPPPDIAAVPTAPRWAIGMHGLVGAPIGDFARNVETTWGGGVDARWFLDRRGIVALRGDLALAGYGSRRGSVSLGFLGGGRATTRNTVAQGTIGLELAVPAGALRPYATAGIGLGVFSTQTSLDDDWRFQDAADRTRTQLEDGVMVRTLGGGLRARVSDAPGSRLLLDLGVRRAWSGPTTYATPADVRFGGGGTGVTVASRRTRTDQWLFTLGFTFTR